MPGTISSVIRRGSLALSIFCKCFTLNPANQRTDSHYESFAGCPVMGAPFVSKDEWFGSAVEHTQLRHESFRVQRVAVIDDAGGSHQPGSTDRDQSRYDLMSVLIYLRKVFSAFPNLRTIAVQNEALSPEPNLDATVRSILNPRNSGCGSSMWCSARPCTGKRNIRKPRTKAMR